ncbi:MAG: hypothetical protein JO235_09250 [Chroococcidiopsidaceae cyanobacterium CP_BM_RX_35]|nr:hypothetical protein [Chroococcidiopsidaceae cyanobacterium CP_BM_RX_35]
MRCKLLSRAIRQTQMTTLVGLLGLGGGLWLTAETFLPQIAWAEAARINLSLDRLPDETFESLVQRAEAVATTAVQTSFQQNNEIANIAVTVVAQNKGAIAPILSLQMTRQEWRSSSTLQPWATYYPNAKALLQFDNVATTSPSPSGSAYTPSNQNRVFNGSSQPRNTTPNGGRGRVFSTPVRPTINSPLTPTQPTIQPGIVNSTPTPSLSPAPGSGMTPTPPIAAPVIPTSNPQAPLPSTNSSPGASSVLTPTSIPLTPLPQLPPNNGTTSNTPGT